MKCKVSGKVFLACSIVLSVTLAYISLKTGYMKPRQGTLLITSLLIFVCAAGNAYKSIKNKSYCYGISFSIMAIALLIFSLIPQIINNN